MTRKSSWSIPAGGSFYLIIKQLRCLMTFKIFARKDKLTEKGVPLVFILEPGKRKISTGFHCKENSWNQKSQAVIVNGPKKDPRAAVINIGLKKASIKLQELIDERCTVDQIRAAIKPKEEIIIPLPTLSKFQKEDYDDLTYDGKVFYNLVERIIQSHTSDWADGYKKRFRTIRTKILWYEPNFKPEMLTEKWWREFTTYCIDNLGNISNTITTDTKTIVALMKELNIKGYEKMQWGYIEPDIQGLSWDKVTKLINLDVSDHYKATINDSKKLWLAGALTGRRWDEISNAAPSNFYKKGTQWWYKNIGKGQKLVDIPLLPEAEEFFTKNKFQLPRLTGTVVNEDIKTICRIATYQDPVLVITPIDANKVHREVKEEWQTVHFHTGRHSYCLHLVEKFAGVPHAEKTISWLMGHASFRTVWKYMNKGASSNEQLFNDIIKKGA
jgi:integrase